MTAAADAFPRCTRFSERAVLGRGSMGTVFRAYDREIDCDVALKVLSDAGAPALLRLKDEFRSLRDVVHPNLVELYDLFAEDPRCFFTMELLSGAPLLAAAHPERRRDVESTASLLLQVADALAVIHAAGKIHRDVKPSNVVVTDVGRAVLLDFGLATSWRPSVDAGPATTQARTPQRRVELAGTLAYMAPEQMWGGEPSPASDWYSLGVVLYEMLTGARPFSDQVALMLHQKQSTTGGWRDLLRTVPNDMAELIVGLLAPDAATRPTAGEVLERLRAHAGAASAKRDNGAMFADHDGPRVASVFVGRERELGCLRRMFDLVCDSGRPACVCISGPSGIGKSTLVRAFLERVQNGHGTNGDDDEFSGRASPALVLTGRCHLQESVPFNALDGVVDDLARCALDGSVSIAPRLAPPERAALVRLFPVLGPVVDQPLSTAESGATPDPLLDAVAFRERGASALRELLDRHSRETPIIVWIDDLQWGDADSATLLRTWLAESTGRVLWVFTHRSDRQDQGDEQGPDIDPERERDPALLNREADCLQTVMQARPSDAHSLDLPCGPLSEEDAHRLAALLAATFAPGVDRTFSTDRGLTEGPLSAPELKALSVQAGGSPFIIHELVQQAAHRKGELGPIRPHTAPAPQSGEDLVDRLIQQRVRALPRSEQQIMMIVASASQPLPSDVVLKAARMRAPSLIRLGRCRMLTRRKIRGRSVIDAYHRRISESIVSSMDPADRRQVHRSIALALEQETARDPELLFNEWLDAGERARAAEYAVQAAALADGALAFVRAAALYGRAADLMGSASRRHASLRRREADALVRAGRGGQAARLYAELARAQPQRDSGESASLPASLPNLDATADTDGPNVITLRQRAVEQYLISGRLDEGFAELRVLLDALGLAFPSTPAKAQLTLAGNLARLLGVCRKSARVVLPHSREGQPNQTLQLTVDVCQGVAKGLAAVDPMRGAAFATLGLRLALRSGDHTRIADGLLLVGGGLLAPMGGWMGAWGMRMIGAARELAEQLGDRRLSGSASVVLGQAHIFAGRWQQAREALDAGLAILARGCAAVAWELNLGHMGVVRALEELGETRAWTEMATALAKDAEARGDRYARVTAELYRGMALLASDDPEAAQRSADAAIGGWPSASFSVQHLYALRLNVLADLYAGRIAAAAERVETAWPSIRRSLLLRVAITRIDAVAMRARALLSLAMVAAGRERRRLLSECSRLRRRLQRETRADAKAHALMLNAAELTIAMSDAGHRSTDERGAISGALDDAAAAYDTLGMTLWSAYARCRRAELVGDQAARASAQRAIAARGIHVPDRWLAVWAPGIWTRA